MKKISLLRLSVIAHDLAMVALAWFIAFFARYNFEIHAAKWEIGLQLLPIVLLIQAYLLWQSGLYKGIWRFASIPDLWNIVRAALLGTLTIALAVFLYNRLETMPRVALILYPAFLVLFLGGPRFLYRAWKDHSFHFTKANVERRAMILGAGRAGEMIARDLIRNGEYRVVGFLDDKSKLAGANLHGIPVLGPIRDIQDYVEAEQIELIVIAIPSVSSARMREIVKACEGTGVQFRTLPPLHKMHHANIGASELREVSIEDLLGREPVTLDWNLIRQGVSGQTILVTGGGGSIGSELCRQIAKLKPTQLVILDHSEFNVYKIEMELTNSYPNLSIRCYLGDVGDEGIVKQIFRLHRPNTLFHAAAYKHVPLLQHQIRSAMKNNVLGTINVAKAADEFQCERFVLISTDKAVNPANIMGSTKRIAEIFCQNFDSKSTTKFITVRFGNVLDSAGSVVPLFREQIKNGGPVTVTHKDITRYFMTIPEATQLILQSGVMGQGGEIFVLDMGEPVRIQYLAEQMIRLSGKAPEVDIPIVYTGLRPGEKLFEELFHEQEPLGETGHGKIFLSNYRPVDWELLDDSVQRIRKAIDEFDEVHLERLLVEMVPETGVPNEAVRVVSPLVNRVVPLRKPTANRTN